MTTDDADIAGLWNNTAFNTGQKEFPITREGTFFITTYKTYVKIDNVHKTSLN